MRRQVLTAIAAAASVALVAQAAIAAPVSAKAKAPKNVIVMISDGWGQNQIDATSYYMHGEPGGQAYADFPFQVAMSTYEVEQPSNNCSPLGYDPVLAWSVFDLREGAVRHRLGFGRHRHVHRGQDQERLHRRGSGRGSAATCHARGGSQGQVHRRRHVGGALPCHAGGLRCPQHQPQQLRGDRQRDDLQQRHRRDHGRGQPGVRRRRPSCRQGCQVRGWPWHLDRPEGGHGGQRCGRRRRRRPHGS